MNKEEKIVRLIVKLFSSDISTKENDEVVDWIAESPEHLRSYQELVNLWQITHPAFAPDSIDEKSAERFIKSLVQKDELTGQSYIKIPIENEEIIGKAITAFSSFLKMFKGL